MPPTFHLLSTLTWKTIRKAKYKVAILPWGATEPHNYHLPYGTDVIESDYIASESARRANKKGANVIVLPTMPFGVNTGQLDLNMTVNMNPSTQAMVFRDVVDSLSRSSVRKLVILNSHGGNDFKQMIRELQPRYSHMFLCAVNWWQILDQKKFFDNPDDHAGEMETSIMLAIAPELVLPLREAGPGKTKPFRIKALRERWAWAPRQWSKTSQDTGAGDPSKATAEKGRRYLEALIGKTAEFLTDLANADISDLYEKRSVFG
ncbi:MAG: creatininase family protein [Ignavibacteriales bacterium]|nr:creatininase family protein [Ignavibacteriales bacterium]